MSDLLSKKVCIIGLGYVGLPLAELCGEKGYDIYGLDIDQKKIESIKKGINPIEGTLLKSKIKASSDEKILKEMDIVVVCVPTPITHSKLPDLLPLEKAVQSIVRNPKKGQLVIIESTINPGVTDEFIIPLFEKARLIAGKDYHIVHCPERVDPGNKKWGVYNIPRVLGGYDEESTKKAYEFYTSVLQSKIKVLSSIKSAEAVKIVENTFRDVNIAFVNELSKSFDMLGIDIIEVIDGASTKPFSFLAHYPGCGVGGHCIPVDPYYIIEDAKKKGFDHEFLRLALKINDSMPIHTVAKLTKSIKKAGLKKEDCVVGLLGLAYKGGIGDTRESPAYDILAELKKENYKVIVFDPFVIEESSAKSTGEILKKCNCIVLATNHPQFKDMDYSRMKVVVDGRNFLDRAKLKKAGVIYEGIGRS